MQLICSEYLHLLLIMLMLWSGTTGMSPNTALEPSTSIPSGLGAGVTGTAGGSEVVGFSDVPGVVDCSDESEVGADVVTTIVVGEEWIWPAIKKVRVANTSVGCCMLLIGVKDLAN